MKILTIRSKKFGLVGVKMDDEDYERLRHYGYYLDDYGYVIRWDKCVVFMHHDIIGKCQLDVDHKDQDKLNNQRYNLRLTTRSNNLQNKRVVNPSGFRGIHQNGSKWFAQIQKDGQQYYLGTYRTKEEAAKAYDKRALELYGEDAALNFPK